jgi:hypothetical protein
VVGGGVVEWWVVGVLWMVEVILVINIVSKSGGSWAACGDKLQQRQNTLLSEIENSG